MTVDWNKLAKEINNAKQNMNMEEVDYVEIEKDSSFDHGYKVTVDYKPGTHTDDDGVMDLQDLFFTDFDNDVINKILDKYRG